MDVPRCFYARWAGEDNVKEDLIILENLYPQVIITYLKRFSMRWNNPRKREQYLRRSKKVFNAVNGIYF